MSIFTPKTLFPSLKLIALKRELGENTYLENIFNEGKTSPPHDHGASWAVYGQAKKFTDMTEWNRWDDKSKDGYAEIKFSKKYRLDPGMAGKFGPHEIHQIHFEAGARFLRVTGSDLFLEETLSYRPDDKSVIARTIGSAANAGEKLTKRHIA